MRAKYLGIPGFLFSLLVPHHQFATVKTLKGFFNLIVHQEAHLVFTAHWFFHTITSFPGIVTPSDKRGFAPL